MSDLPNQGILLFSFKPQCMVKTFVNSPPPQTREKRKNITGAQRVKVTVIDRQDNINPFVDVFLTFLTANLLHSVPKVRLNDHLFAAPRLF
jgi:hypothetical protein